MNSVDWGVGVELRALENGATRHISPSANAMTDCLMCHGNVKTASCNLIPIEGYGDLFASTSNLKDCNDSTALLQNVAHAPRLSHTLLSLRAVTDKNHTYIDQKDGVLVRLKSGQTLFAPPVGKINCMHSSRPKPTIPSLGTGRETYMKPIILPIDGANPIRPNFRRTITPSFLPMYVWSLSATARIERRS